MHLKFLFCFNNAHLAERLNVGNTLIKWKTQNTIVRTVQNKSRTDRDNIKTSNTNIHDPSLSWLDTDRRRHCIARCMGMQIVPSKEIYTMADIA